MLDVGKNDENWGKYVKNSKHLGWVSDYESTYGNL